MKARNVLFTIWFGRRLLFRLNLETYLLVIGVWWKIGLILSSGISKQCAVPKDSLDFNGFKTFTSAMNDFVDCMENLKVIDHPFIGTLFTRCNMRLEAPLFRKLDRVLVNLAWHSCFPVSVVEFLPLDVTNHSLSLNLLFHVL